MSRKSWIKTVLLIVSCIILYRQLLPLAKLIYTLPLNDFSVYLDGIKATFTHQNPYKLWFFDRYNYSPSTTLLLLPFSLLPINFSEYFFTVLSLLSLGLVLIISQKLLSLKLSLPATLLIYSLLVKLYPVKLTLILGQINLIVLMFMILSFYFYTRNNKALSGIALGLATIIKFTPALLIIFYFLKKETKIINYWISTFLLVAILAIITFGPSLTTYYYVSHLPGLIRETSQELVKTDYMNQGITALMGRYNIFELTSTLLRNIITLSLTLTLAVRLTKTKTIQAEFLIYTLMIIVATIFAPVFVWQHHFAFTVPALLVLLITALKTSKRHLIFLTLLSLFMLDFYFRDPAIPPKMSPVVASHFLVAAITVFIATASIPLKLLNPKKK